MTYSKSVGILLILALGLSISLQGRAQEVKASGAAKAIANAKKKKEDKKKKAVKKNAVSTNSISTAPVLKSTLEVVKPTTPPKSPYSFAGVAEYYPQSGKHSDGFMAYAVDARYRFNPHHMVRFVQPVIQNLRPKEEWLMDNAIFFYYYRLNPDVKDYSIGTRFRIDAGTSKQSRADGINSVEQIRLEFSKNVDNFSFGLRPYVSHYSTDYSTNAKGDPLPLFGLGHSLALGYKISEKWGIDAEVDTGFKMLQPEEVKRARAMAEEEGKPASDVMETTKSSFGFLVEVGYLLSEKARLHVGYAQNDKLMADGKYGVDFLNANTSRGYFGFSYSF